MDPSARFVIQPFVFPRITQMRRILPSVEKMNKSKIFQKNGF